MDLFLECVNAGLKTTFLKVKKLVRFVEHGGPPLVIYEKQIISISGCTRVFKIVF